MISIITPVYNVENFIEETINSVLNQTFTDYELILVNDCSTDNSVEKIKRYSDPRIRLVNQPENKGAAAARNRGLEEAKGRYIAFLDGDDLWASEKLEHEFALMEKEHAAFVFTGYEFADAKGNGTGAVVRVPDRLDFKHALLNSNIFTSTVLIDREQIPDELIRMPYMKSEDTATWWTILKAGFEARGLNENLVLYRRSAGTLSSNKIEAMRRIWNLYRKIAELSVLSSALHFVSWAVTAVHRRLKKRQ